MTLIEWRNSVRKSIEHHKAKKALSNVKRRNRVRSWLLEQKNKPCVDCGKQLESHLMHFDHRDPNQKLFGIASNVLSFGWDKLRLEVSKCDIRCHLCHRIRSEAQGFWTRGD